jgi:hypothetical protein
VGPVIQLVRLGLRNCSLGAGGRVIISRRRCVGENVRAVAGGRCGGGFDLLQVGADLLEGVEDAACVGDLDAVVSDGLQDTGEGVEALLAGGGSGDGEVATGDAPGGPRLAEGAARRVMVVAEGFAAEGG